jgi:hypothetical protein
MMDEPALYNHTAFHVSVLPILDRDGAQCRVVIVKATYAMSPGRGLDLAEHQREVRFGDELWGAPEVPDVRLPGDLCAAKPGTDVIVSGYAVPPHAQSARSVDVNIRIAGRMKVLRVHGEREWRASVLGVVPGPSAVLRRTPLARSRAYGGTDLSDPTRPVEEPRNPVGSGVARDPDRLIGRPAPQIESPDEPIGRAGGGFVPVGCAPLGRHFGTRRTTMGTYDQAWLDSVYPARPQDYREEHENCAPDDFVFRSALVGGEPVTLTGVHAAGPLAFTLPKHRLLIEAAIDGDVLPRRPHLDTVVLDTSAMLVELVWRGLYRCPAKMRNRFKAIRVQAKEFLQ